ERRVGQCQWVRGAKKCAARRELPASAVLGDELQLAEGTKEPMRTVPSKTTLLGGLRVACGQRLDHTEPNRGRDGLRAPEPDHVAGQRFEPRAPLRPKLDNRLSRLVDHLERAVEALDTSLPIVEGLDCGEASGVNGPAAHVDVRPS